MKSRWSEAERRAVVEGYVAKGVNPDLALRVYTTRLLGSDPELVLHGGGNTSVKTMFRERDGTEIPVICVKGSGWDMAVIEPEGLPACKLPELAALARFERLSDPDMVAEQRRLLIDPSAPNPSVEAILHALIPAAHVDHTHANAIVALTNQPEGEALTRELFPESLIVPYVMPGFDLAKTCAKALAASARRQKHGAAEARRLHLGRRRARGLRGDDRAGRPGRAAAARAGGRGRLPPAPLRSRCAAPHEYLPILRGRLAQATAVEGAPKRMVLTLRTSPTILDLCNAPNAADLVARGNATPEHVIHIKRKGVSLPAPQAGKLDAFAAALDEALAAYAADYRAYFERNAARVGGRLTMLDPLPRVFYIRGVGVVAAGASAKGGRSRASCGSDRRRHRQGGRAERLGAAAGTGSVRRRILVAGASQARQGAGKAVVATGRGRDRRGQRARSRDSQGSARRRAREVAVLDIAEGVVGVSPRLGGLRWGCGSTSPTRRRSMRRSPRSCAGSAASTSSSPTRARRSRARLTEVSDETFATRLRAQFLVATIMSRAPACASCRRSGTGGALRVQREQTGRQSGAGFRALRDLEGGADGA